MSSAVSHGVHLAFFSARLFPCHAVLVFSDSHSGTNPNRDLSRLRLKRIIIQKSVLASVPPFRVHVVALELNFVSVVVKVTAAFAHEQAWLISTRASMDTVRGGPANSAAREFLFLNHF